MAQVVVSRNLQRAGVLGKFTSAGAPLWIYGAPTDHTCLVHVEQGEDTSDPSKRHFEHLMKIVMSACYDNDDHDHDDGL